MFCVAFRKLVINAHVPYLLHYQKYWNKRSKAFIPTCF